MSTFNRLSVLATKGNRAVKSGGEDVYNSRGETTVLPGEIAVFNPKTGKTLAVGDLSSASEISIGVGVRVKGKTVLRRIGSDSFNVRHDKMDVTTSPASCGCPQIIDIFPTCLECGEEYGIALHLDDYLVRSMYDYQDRITYTFSQPVKCESCDDCDRSADAEAWLSAIRDQINSKSQTELSKQILPRVSRFQGGYQPIRAALLHANTFSYTLPLTDDDCEDCVAFDAIGGATVDGDTVTFTNVTDPADGTRTLVEQKDELERQLNEVLEPIGSSAYITTSDLPCCDWKLEVNTCDENFVLRDESGDAITPDGGAATNPLAAIQQDPTYASCDNSGSTFTPTTGLRIFVDPINWYIDGEPLIDTNEVIPNTFIRNIEVDTIGDSWDRANLHVVETCKAENVHGLGIYWVDKELKMQHKGGDGRNFRYSRNNWGRNQIPDPHSRARNLAVDPKQAYCVYNILEETQGRTKGLNKRNVFNHNLTWLLVPQADSTTQTSLETYGAELVSLGYAFNFGSCS